MRRTIVHNGADKSPRQSTPQRTVEPFNGISSHSEKGSHGEKLEKRQYDLSRSCANVKLFDDSFVPRVNGGDLEVRGCCKVVAPQCT